MADSASGVFESFVLDKRRFTCDADSEAEVDLSEWDNEVLPNSDGTFRQKKTRHMQKIEKLTADIDVERGDLEFISEAKASFKPLSFSATRADGGIYDGEVVITDSTSFNDSKGTMELTLAGRIRRL